MDKSSKPRRPLTVLRGRHGQYVAEQREPTTRFPRAGESIQAHMVLLRAPAQRVIEQSLAAGYQWRRQAGVYRIFLNRPLSDSDYVRALVAAYQSIQLPGAAIAQRVTSKAFGSKHEAESRRFVDLVISGDLDAAADLESTLPLSVALTSFSMLSDTTKMGCYSFNLPAGPIFQEGTCPASQLGFMYESEDELAREQRASLFADPIVVGDFICNGCYAIKGSYGNPAMIFVMAMRHAITKRWLKEGVFSERLVEAIRAARDKSRAQRRAADPELLWAIPHPDFFRIHDAGDFYSAEYVNAWFDVCEALPDINFWAPTRMWAINKGAATAFDRGVPTNLALRPSALHFGERAPRVTNPNTAEAAIQDLVWRGEAVERVIPGAAAGSGSGKAPARDEFPCPAYDHVEQGGGAVLVKGRLAGGTCARAHGPDSPFRGGNSRDEEPSPKGHGCRACWLHRDLGIFYHEH